MGPAAPENAHSVVASSRLRVSHSKTGGEAVVTVGLLEYVDAASAVNARDADVNRPVGKRPLHHGDFIHYSKFPETTILQT